MASPLARMIHAQAQAGVRHLSDADRRFLRDLEAASLAVFGQCAPHPVALEDKWTIVDDQWVKRPHWRRLDNRGDVAAQDFVEDRP